MCVETLTQYCVFHLSDGVYLLLILGGVRHGLHVVVVFACSVRLYPGVVTARADESVYLQSFMCIIRCACE